MGTVLAAIKLGWHQNGFVEPAIFWQASLIDTAKEACGEKLDESTPGRPCTLSPEFGGANTPREYSGEIFPRIHEIFPEKRRRYDEETARDNYFNPPAGHRSGPGGPTDA